MYSSVDTIKKMIEDGNIEDVKIRILNGIQMNSSMEYFTDLMDCLENTSINIFDQNTDYEMVLDKNQWTINYLVQIRSKLKFNFSKEKLEHYNDIAIYVSNEEVKAKSEKNHEERDGSKESIVEDSKEGVKVKSEKRYVEKDRHKQPAKTYKTKNKNEEVLKNILVVIACVFSIVILVKLFASVISHFEKLIKEKQIKDKLINGRIYRR